MKKLLLSMLCAVTALGAAAQGDGVFQMLRNQNARQSSQTKAPARAEGDEGSLWYSYCADEIGSGLGINSNTPYYIVGAMVIDEGTATKLAGCKVNSVKMGLGDVKSDSIYIFVQTEPNTTPVVMERHKITLGERFSWYQVDFDNPYEITGEEFIVGYSYATPKGQVYPLGVDMNVSANSPGGLVRYGDDPDPSTMDPYQNISSQFGNVSLMCEIKGQLPELYPRIDMMTVPSLARLFTPIEASVYVTNIGSGNINTAEFTYKVGATEVVQTVTLDEPITPGAQGVFKVQGIEIEEPVSTPFELTVNSINGEEQNVKFTTKIQGTAAKSNRMMVAEESTCIGCGFCPRGIWGFEYMNEKYPEGFIGIASHNNAQTTDPMTIDSYKGVANYTNGNPGCQVNRTADYLPSGDPNPYDLEDCYLTYFKDAPAMCDVELDVVWTNEEETDLALFTTTTFGIDAKNTNGSKYRISYIIMEDQVGPYKQQNSFSGGGYGECGGWENKSQRVSWLYNDVARYCSGLNGVMNTLPKELVSGEPYETFATISLTGLKNSQKQDIVINPKNITVVALVLQYSPRAILNAVKVPYSAIRDFSGINNITVDTPSVSAYYDLTGMPVANPTPGQIYIVVKDGKASKVLWK